MQTAQDLIFVSSYVPLELAVCNKMTILKDQMEDLSLLPIENEEDVRALKIALEKFISDTQALSQSLPEGTRSDDINLGHFRSTSSFEKGAGSAAA